MANSDAARYLTEWKRTYGLTDEAAAAWCRIAVSTFRRQRRGVSRRAEQTVALAELYPIARGPWLEVAELSMKVARLLSRPR